VYEHINGEGHIKALSDLKGKCMTSLKLKLLLILLRLSDILFPEEKKSLHAVAIRFSSVLDYS